MKLICPNLMHIFPTLLTLVLSQFFNDNSTIFQPRKLVITPDSSLSLKKKTNIIFPCITPSLEVNVACISSLVKDASLCLSLYFPPYEVWLYSSCLLLFVHKMTASTHKTNQQTLPSLWEEKWKERSTSLIASFKKYVCLKGQFLTRPLDS